MLTIWSKIGFMKKMLSERDATLTRVECLGFSVAMVYMILVLVISFLKYVF